LGHIPFLFNHTTQIWTSNSVRGLGCPAREAEHSPPLRGGVKNAFLSLILMTQLR